MQEYDLECAIVRGGTTKGVYLDSRQLPDDTGLRDRILLSLLGSPDIRQINGLGGSDPLTSKVALIRPSEHPDADIDYLSGEVNIDVASINYSTMCGNLASGVALFARAIGLVNNFDSAHPIRIRNLNTGKFLSALPQVQDGVQPFIRAGNIDGVQGYGIEIDLSFHDPAGPITGKLLPTDDALNTLSIAGSNYSTSIVDCGTLYAFFLAGELGLTGRESAETIDAALGTCNLIEQLRGAAAELLSRHLDRAMEPKQLKISVISEIPEAERSTTDIVARVVNRYKTHKVYPVTGAICLSAAALIPGTLVHSCIRPSGTTTTVRIAHPSGTMQTGSILAGAGQWHIESANIHRTARLLMLGRAQVIIDNPIHTETTVAEPAAALRC